jgi:chromosome segregation ATPase
VDEDVPAAKRRMLKGRKREMALNPSVSTSMNGYTSTRKAYMRERAKMMKRIQELFDPNPTNPDDYMVAKKAMERLVPLINEKRNQTEALNDEIAREQVAVRRLDDRIRSVTNEMKQDLTGSRQNEGCYDETSLEAKHGRLVSEIRALRNDMCSHQDKITTLSRRKWLLDREMRRVGFRREVLHKRSRGALSSLSTRAHLAESINRLIHRTLFPSAIEV